MAKNRNQSRASSMLFERAQRELAKGNVKAALKDAEACVRQNAAPENRLLLERIYVKRVEQLYAQSMTTEARAVLQKLLDMHPTDPETLSHIPRLRVAVGDAGVDAASVLEGDPALLTSLADQAVLNQRSTAPRHGGVSQHVTQIRSAFAAVEQGDDNAAAEALRTVPHNSPLGDWKLFLRGLSLFYAKEMESAEANWARLDPQRPAFRIAQTLLVADGRLNANEAKVDVSRHVAALVTRTPTDPALGPLRTLAKLWREENFGPFFKEYRGFRQRFAKSHASLLAKIVDMVWKYAVRDGDDRMFREIKAIGPAPAMDPRWNRASALNEEFEDDCFDRSIEQSWVAYCADLEQTPLQESERAIATGLIYLHLAGALQQSAARADKPPEFGWVPYNPDEGEKLRKDAARYLRRAVEACPRLHAAYWGLARFHQQQDEPDKSAAVLRRLLGVVPDDFEAHLWLANYYLGETEPLQSAPHVDAALRLRPRDPQCDSLRWNQRMASIRSLAAARKFADARRQIEEAAEVMREEDAEPYAIEVMRAALELRAKQRDASDRHLAAAMQMSGEPAAVWLAMIATAAGFRVPRAVTKEYEARYKSALLTHPTSRTAGALARRLNQLKLANQNYTGRATQERLATVYLERSINIEWEEADLLAVCQLLGAMPKYAGLKAMLAAKGLKRFPDNGCFCYWVAIETLAARKRQGGLSRAIQLLEHAIPLLEASRRPIDRGLVQLAKNALSNAYEWQQTQKPWEGIFGESYYYDEDDDEDDDDDGCEDGIFDASLFGLPEDIDMSPEALQRAIAEMLKHLPEGVKAVIENQLAEIAQVEAAQR